MEWLILLLLILLNGVFSMSEIALVSLRRVRLESALKRGDKAAAKALELSHHPGRFLSTVQIGITLIGILTGIYSGEKLEEDLIAFFNRYDSLNEYSETLAVTLIVIVLTFFTLVLGELVPKRIGLTMPERIAKTMAFPMYWISVITAPFIWLLTITSDLIIRILRLGKGEDNRVTVEEIKAIVREGRTGGAIEAIEQDIVERVFSLGDRKVASLMTFRSDITALNTTDDTETVRDKVKHEMHSVYPVLNEKTEVEGVIYLKDLFVHLGQPGFRLSDHLHLPQHISEKSSAYQALQLFKATRVHQAIVTDERGQLQGLITLNDLLEALVGDASEFHAAEYTFIQRGDGSWLIDGQYPLPELMRRLDLEVFIADYPFDTLSGLVLNELRNIPKAGDKLRWLDFELEVMDMDGARIDKILLSRI